MAINFTKSIEVFGGVVWSETIRCSDQKFADAFAYLLNKKMSDQCDMLNFLSHKKTQKQLQNYNTSADTYSYYYE